MLPSWAAVAVEPLSQVIWRTEQQGAEKESGWAGVFNRSGEKKTANVSLKSLGLNPDKAYDLYDVWGDKPFKPGQVELEPNDCAFIRYIKQQ